jgi:hypothetical protein
VAAAAGGADAAFVRITSPSVPTTLASSTDVWRYDLRINGFMFDLVDACGWGAMRLS